MAALTKNERLTAILPVMDSKLARARFTNNYWVTVSIEEFELMRDAARALHNYLELGGADEQQTSSEGDA
jgi:hypothetical protein